MYATRLLSGLALAVCILGATATPAPMPSGVSTPAKVEAKWTSVEEFGEELKKFGNILGYKQCFLLDEKGEDAATYFTIYCENGNLNVKKLPEGSFVDKGPISKN